MEKLKEDASSLNLRNIFKDKKTDLDTLYTLLREKGKMSISSIARMFKKIGRAHV